MTPLKIILSGVALLALSSSCSSGADKQHEETAVDVRVSSPVALQEDGIFISGMVSASQTAQLSTRMMGFVEKIYVRQGEQVKEGQLLLVINSDDLNAKKAQAESMVMEAEAAARNANRDYERFKALHAKKSVSDKELENIELNRTSINAKLQMARQGMNEVNAMLAYTNIRAPFSGVITQKLIDEGSTANPGMPLIGIEKSGEMHIKASVPENFVPYIQVGDSVRVDIKSLEKRISGVISELSPSSSMTGGQYGVKIALGADDETPLQAGMYAGVFIPGKTDGEGITRIWVDQSSVVKRDQLTGVYVVTPDNRAMLRWVRLGKATDKQVEVLSGIQTSDRVICQAEGKLHNGKKVRIVK